MDRKFDQYVEQMAKQEKIKIPCDFESRTEEILEGLSVNDLCREHINFRHRRIFLRTASVAILLVILSVSSILAYEITQRYKLENVNSEYGHLSFQDADGKPYEYTGGQEINQKVEVDGLEVICKSIVLDTHIAYIRLELSTKDGSSLVENTQYKNTVLDRQKFQEIHMKVDGKQFDENKLETYRIDYGEIPDKAEFELKMINDQVDLSGKNIQLDLKDFLDVYEETEDIGFSFDSALSLLHATGGKIYFASRYSDIYLEKMDYEDIDYGHDDKMWKRKMLVLTVGLDQQGDKSRIDNLVFQDKESGSVYSTEKKWLNEQKAEIKVDIPQDELSNYVITAEKNRGYERDVKYTGTWKFRFNIDKDRVSQFQKYTRIGNINAENFNFNINEVTLSDLSLDMTVTLTSGKSDDFHDIAKSYLVLEDGRKVLVGNMGDVDFSDQSRQQFHCYWNLKNLVDAKKVKAIEWYGTVFELK